MQQVAGLLVFTIIYMENMFPLNAEPEHRVKVMNDMFTHVGWLEWPDTRKTDYDNGHIVDHWTNKITDISELLAPSDNGQIVTEENVEHKMLQAHQFLSCKYATALNKLCEHLMGLCPACRRWTAAFDSLDFLEYLLDFLGKSEPLVMYMRGSLLCFQDLSPATPFERQLLEILEALIDYCGTMTAFDGASVARGGHDTVVSTVASKSASVENHMSETLERLNEFHGSFCWIEEADENGRHAKRVQRYLKGYDPDRIMSDVVAHIKDKIHFMEYFDGRFGFKYDFDSKTTVLMYDPDLLRRVDQMNELLGHPGWTQALNRLEIITPDRMVTFPEFIAAGADGKIVTKANVDQKVEHTHRFLNCYYATTLKRCAIYVKLLWKQYSASKHLPDSSNLRAQFVNAMMMSKPLVSRLQDALSLIYNLSPSVIYSVDVSDILTDFNSYFHSRDTIDNEIVQGNLGIENDMNNIVQRLNTSYKKNCIPCSMMKTCLKESAKDKTFSSLIDNFLDEIGKFMFSNYENLGFPF